MPMFVFDDGVGARLLSKDIADSSFLMHYRVGGEVNGRRRWQNADGSYTPEGYKHYADMYGWGQGRKTSEFRETEKEVRSKLDNTANPFHAKPVDILTVRIRGGVSLSDARKCASLAEEAFKRASSSEPEITKLVTNIVGSTGSKMYGLDNRLKQPESIAAKIGSEAVENGISYEEAVKGLKDLVRYTAVSTDSQFVQNYNRIKADLEKNGYKEIRCRNYFDRFEQGKAQHKSVQSVFRDQDGNVFEMQFQTVSSQAAKELKIPLYEKARSNETDDVTKAGLEKQMHDLATQVRNPKDVLSIQEHDGNDFRNGRLMGPTSDESKDKMRSVNKFLVERTRADIEKHQPPVEKLSELKTLPDEVDWLEQRRNINHPVEEDRNDVAGRQYNCPNCACAFELTERGYDVTARRAPDGSNVGDIEKFFKGSKLMTTKAGMDFPKLPDEPEGYLDYLEGGQKYLKRAYRDKQARAKAQRIFDEYEDRTYDWSSELYRKQSDAIDELRETLLSQKDGARGIIVVGWLEDDGYEPTHQFHAMNYKVEGNQVKMYDSQSYRAWKHVGSTNLEDFLTNDTDPREIHYMRTDNLELDPSITQTVYSRGRGQYDGSRSKGNRREKTWT